MIPCARFLPRHPRRRHQLETTASRTAPTIGKIEARLRRVNDAELWLLAAALGAEIAELFPAASRRKPPAALISVARHSED